jgi:hypothetical protein
LCAEDACIIEGAIAAAVACARNPSCASAVATATAAISQLIFNPPKLPPACKNNPDAGNDAKAPGVPTTGDGYKPPKGWDGQTVPNPNGPGRGYPDKWGRISLASAFFVIRAKSNLKCRRVYSHQVDKSAGLLCDQSVLLTGYYQSKDYPEKLRRVKYYDAENDKTLVFLTNNFSLPAMTIAELYRCRWQVELFFKWIKQNLRIKTFYGTSENAVKAQIWIAISVYVLVAIMKKRLKIKASLYTILQVLSVTIFERMPLLQALTEADYKNETGQDNNQLILFS